MKRLFVLTVAAASAAFFIGNAHAASNRPVCTAPALAALAKLPQMPMRCEDAAQICKSDTPSSLLDNAECAAAVTAYGKTLRAVLPPRWWNVPADALEACRVRRKPGVLTKDEADKLDQEYGSEVQGNDRVRMLALEDACGIAGISNVVLAVKTSAGISVTPLSFAFNQGGEEAPFSFDVVSNGNDTIALFSTQGHDMQDIYTTTTAYKVDLASGQATRYPLYVTAQGEQTELGSSEPIGAELDEKNTAEIVKGRFAGHFINYEANSCPDEKAGCPPVKTESFTWNGKAFIDDDFAAKNKAYMRGLAAQRECLRQKFDPKTATAVCSQDYPCEGNNDLSFLSLKAGKADRAREYAEDAMEYCRGSLKDTAAAQYNYRRSVEAGLHSGGNR